jgi:hypothetical protein
MSLFDAVCAVQRRLVPGTPPPVVPDVLWGLQVNQSINQDVNHLSMLMRDVLALMGKLRARAMNGRWTTTGLALWFDGTVLLHDC